MCFENYGFGSCLWKCWNILKPTLHYESRAQKKTFLLIYHIVALTWPQGTKNTYKLGKPICNPWGQCCCNKILLFWWNSHCRIKIKLNQTLYLLFFHIISLHFPFLLLSLWMMKGVFTFSTWNMTMKNTKITRILCPPIHGGLTFRV